MKSFFAELQRRHVYKVGAAYAVAGWLLVQIVTQVFPIFEVSCLAQRIIVLVIVAGFPISLVLAWFFDLTVRGIVRTGELPATGESPGLRRERYAAGRRLNCILAALLFVAIAYFAAERFGLINGSRKTSIATTAINAKSIAVLPFDNFSDDKQNTYFADGIQDDILTAISKVSDLKVISRNSVMQYRDKARNTREIGQALGVAYLLEGSVRRANDEVRITAQLIDAWSDRHVWAEHYDRDLADVFAIQSEVAGNIVAQLKANISPSEKAAIDVRPTRDLEAFDIYLQAKQLINTFYDTPDWKETLLKAVRFLDEAISRDGNFALAYCWAARAHLNLYWFGLDHTNTDLRDRKSTRLNSSH